MSFIGSIGFLMEGSGFSDVFEQCYGPHPVLHMLPGKAISKDVRGFILVDSALSIMLSEEVFKRMENESDTRVTDEDMCHLTNLYEGLLHDGVQTTEETVYSSPVVKQIQTSSHCTR